MFNLLLLFLFKNIKIAGVESVQASAGWAGGLRDFGPNIQIQTRLKTAEAELGGIFDENVDQ